jgi:hypothetical protein
LAVFVARIGFAAMRRGCIGIVTVLGLIAAPAFAQCEDKSQQNAADEAGLKGDLDAASKCATPQQVEQSQKKLEDAAANAKSKQEGRRPDQNGGSDRR